MKADHVVRLSALMANVSLVIIIVMLILNALSWFMPAITVSSGMSLGLSSNILQGLVPQLDHFPWWQRLGCIVISSIPLLALSLGLWQMRALFRGYQRRDYFSATAARHLSLAAKAIVGWVLLNFVCEPFLSVFATLRAPAGQHVLTLSFSSPDFVALYLAGCLAVIAFIMRRACEVSQENQQFI